MHNAVIAIRRVKASNSDAKGYDAWQALHKVCLGASEDQRKRNLWKELNRACVSTGETYEDFHSRLSATALALEELGESVKDDTLKNALVAGIEDDPRFESTVQLVTALGKPEECTYDELVDEIAKAIPRARAAKSTAPTGDTTRRTDPERIPDNALQAAFAALMQRAATGEAESCRVLAAIMPQLHQFGAGGSTANKTREPKQCYECGSTEHLVRHCRARRNKKAADAKKKKNSADPEEGP